MIPGRTLYTEGSSWNPKEFYLERKRFYLESKRVLLWGQPKKPFGTLLSMCSHADTADAFLATDLKIASARPLLLTKM